MDELGIGGLDSVPDAPLRGKDAVQETHEERKGYPRSSSFLKFVAEAVGAASSATSAADPAMSELEERLNNLKRN